MSQPNGDFANPVAGERFWHALRDAVRQAVVVDERVIRLLDVALLAPGHA